MTKLSISWEYEEKTTEPEKKSDRIDLSCLLQDYATRKNVIVLHNFVICGWEYGRSHEDTFYFESEEELLEQWLENFIATEIENGDPSYHKVAWQLSDEEETEQSYKVTSFTNRRSWESGWDLRQEISIYYPRSTPIKASKEKLWSSYIELRGSGP